MHLHPGPGTQRAQLKRKKQKRLFVRAWCGDPNSRRSLKALLAKLSQGFDELTSGRRIHTPNSMLSCFSQLKIMHSVFIMFDYDQFPAVSGAFVIPCHFEAVPSLLSRLGVRDCLQSQMTHIMRSSWSSSWAGDRALKPSDEQFALKRCSTCVFKMLKRQLMRYGQCIQHGESHVPLPQMFLRGSLNLGGVGRGGGGGGGLHPTSSPDMVQRRS